MNRSSLLCGAICLLALLGQNASASNTCRTDAGRFVSIQGMVEVQPATGGRWQSTTLEYRLCQGDSIRVGVQSRAAIALVNDAVLRLDENTTMRLVNVNPQDEERSFLDLVRGGIMSFSRKPKRLEVSTPYLNGSIEGTEFAFLVGEGESQLTVFEGTVIAANAMGALPVSGGQTAVAAEGQAPQPRILVRPRDAVQWSLYYPPILAAGGTEGAELQEAASLLAVGRVDEALARVDQAITQQTDAGLAYALRSVIRVAQNDVEAALADGQRAVSLTDAAAARIALSYAQQADFQIEAARDTMGVAVEQHPEDALAWARLAELWLMQGNRREARVAAERAVELQPDLGRTQSILGFAALAELRVEPAQEAFSKAIALDSADPMPHLGLGLARIRAGRLAEGRADIESAVALDSNAALLRAYLGRAYFEEKRGPLDAEQFEMAKQLDPNDPTAFFYDAIRLQTENQPVAALQELQASTERNDNRAVFRSRLLLDQDRAARGASHARIYNDLGFRQQGINEATRSVTIDPANASAHRFLSDVYLTAPRYESARVSEMLQAQMLQQVNINPVQPSLAEANLNLVTQGGPAGAGFNEFTPLFESNRAQVNASGLGGSNDTLGGELVVSGVYDQVSLSAGAFGYDTDGYRTNNDLRHEIYNVFGQFAVTPTLNLQAEYQQRDTRYGDLSMNFDPEVFSPDQRNELDTESFRAGATLRPSADTTFMLLYNHRDTTWTRADEFVIDGIDIGDEVLPVVLAEDITTDETADQVEATFIYQAPGFNIVTGAAYTDISAKEGLDVVIFEPTGDPNDPVEEIPIVQDVFDLSSRETRGYIYANVTAPTNVTWTLGVSHQDGDGDDISERRTNPKFGVTWDVTDDVRLRAAYFDTQKPLIASNRTLEPTHVAGFNQLFDDVDFTRATRYGIAADWRPLQTVALGAEWTRRELESPVFSFTGDVLFEDRDEWTHRVYATWTPTPEWALSIEAVYDKFENDDDSALAPILPERVRTVSVPMKATYFHPRGYFGSVGVTYVDQQVRRSVVSDLPQGDSQFGLVDLSIGYRLPKRQGLVSLSVNNLFDEQFEYQDDSYRKFGDEPVVSPYIPARVIMGRVVLSF